MWQKNGPKRSSSAMHVLLLLICVLPGGGASTGASLEGSSGSKSPGRALAVTDSCRNLWGESRCAKKAKKSKCSAECNTKSCKKVQAKCELACMLCTPSTMCADVWSQSTCKKKSDDDKCNKKEVQQNCKLTCGGCQSPSPPPPSPSPPPPTPPPPSSPPDCGSDFEHGAFFDVPVQSYTLTAQIKAGESECSTTTTTTTTTTNHTKSAWYPSRSSRAGKNLPTDQAVTDEFISFLRERASTVGADDYIQPIKDFKSLVEQDPHLKWQFDVAFQTARLLKKGLTPLDTPAVKNFDEFLRLLNKLMVTAPAYYLDPEKVNDPSDDPAGLIAFPINALLAWPMATRAGQGLFANALVNDCFLRVLNHWQENFLTTKGSRYVLPPNATYCPQTFGAAPKRQRQTPALPLEKCGLPPNSVGWLHEGAKTQMVKVAFNFVGNDNDVVVINQTFVCEPRKGSVAMRPTFEQVFELPNPEDLDYYGFANWDDFFLRNFSLMRNKKGLGPRPLNGLMGYQPWPDSTPDDDSVIVNACESAPLTLVHNVSADSQFWLKGQEYSLNNMLHRDELADTFVGGSVYQAYLSALSYHRFNSPVSGTVVKVVKIPGTYYLENIHTGFEAEFVPDKENFTTGKPDAVGPNDSQKFLTAVATRMAIYIQAKDPNIGLMCFLAIGMAEVSSCEADVVAGQNITKGEPIGKFHYGGSTHCLIFSKKAADKLTFYTEKKMPDGKAFYNTSPGINATNVPVLAQIAKCG